MTVGGKSDMLSRIWYIEYCFQRCFGMGPLLRCGYPLTASYETSSILGEEFQGLILFRRVVLYGCRGGV